jgi:hypothetical protein
LLPPSYKSFVKRFLRKAEPVNLHQLMARIRLHEIEPSHVDIIDLTVYVIYNVIDVS